jgi:hypothetical protein
MRQDPDRRKFLQIAGANGAALAGGLVIPGGFGVPRRAHADGEQTPSQAADYTIRIAPASLEIAPGKVIKTTAYNGSVHGPVLRLREGRPVRIKVVNDSGYANLIHWRGLHLPSAQDGASEEGSPIIQPGDSLIYAYTPKPAGTRWYHSHALAITDLTKSTYSGEFGFLLVEPAAGDPGSYDREVLLASHTWEGHWVSMQDLKKGPPPDNGLEAMYDAASQRPLLPIGLRYVRPARRLRSIGSPVDPSMQILDPGVEVRLTATRNLDGRGRGSVRHICVLVFVQIPILLSLSTFHQKAWQESLR